VPTGSNQEIDHNPQQQSTGLVLEDRTSRAKDVAWTGRIGLDADVTVGLVMAWLPPTDRRRRDIFRRRRGLGPATLARRAAAMRGGRPADG
jgi:hypothetical protein